MGPRDTRSRRAGTWSRVPTPDRDSSTSGVVKRVADGLTDKRSQRCSSILPAGALLWGWAADTEFDEKEGEQWMVLHPAKFNKHVQYAWRFDPCELGASEQRKPRPREPLVEDAATDG